MAEQCCLLCGWTIYNAEDPEGVSWSNQFRAGKYLSSQRLESLRDIDPFLMLSPKSSIH